MNPDNQGTKRFSLLRSLRGARDSLMEDLAKVTLAFTSTHAYQRASAAISKPQLLASALLKEKREAAMSDVLAQLNMPSREEVLTLSKRLTRIEMVLDDLSAGMDQLRRSSVRPQRLATREASIRDGQQSSVLAALTQAPQTPKEA